MLQIFFHSVLAIIKSSTAAFRGSRVRAADNPRINKLIGKVGSLAEVELGSLVEVCQTTEDHWQCLHDMRMACRR